MEPDALVRQLQNFCRICWEFRVKILENADREWLVAASAKVIACQHILLIVTGLLRDADEIGNTQRYYELELLSTEDALRQLLGRQ